MTIKKGDKTIEVSSWELATIIGGLTTIATSICTVLGKKSK